MELLVRFEYGRRSWWAPPGGGLEEGETYEDASRREVEEETSLNLRELGPWVLTREHVFRFEGRLYRQVERYFMVTVSAFTPRLAVIGLEEAVAFRDLRWWAVESHALIHGPGHRRVRVCYARRLMDSRTDALPEGFSVRAPAWDDADAVADLISACTLVDGGEVSTTTEELLDDWQDVDLATEAIVVSAPDGRIAGYADVVNRAYVVVSVYGYVHPEYRGRGVGAYLVAWGEDWVRDRIPHAPEDARVIVQHYVSASNESARRLLEGKGYAPVRALYTMAIDLGEAPPPPEWPEGLRVRTFVPGRDDRAAHEAVEDAFRDVWGRPYSPFERFAKLTEHEVFDPSLWFLACDGPEIAGLALFKLVGGQGWADVVGVRRPWRGRGLGLALLRHAFGEYYRRGIKRVGLSVDAESVTGAPGLYSRAGMHVTNSYVMYRRELRPGVDITVRSAAT